MTRDELDNSCLLRYVLLAGAGIMDSPPPQRKASGAVSTCNKFCKYTHDHVGCTFEGLRKVATFEGCKIVGHVSLSGFRAPEAAGFVPPPGLGSPMQVGAALVEARVG